MGFLSRNKTRRLQRAYEAKLKEAMEAQRNGDIQGFAALTQQAQAIYAQVQELESASS